VNQHGGLSGRWVVACLAISALCLGLGLGFRNGGLDTAANVAGLVAVLPLVVTLVGWARQRDNPRTWAERMRGVRPARPAGLSPPMMWLAVLTLSGVTVALAADYILSRDPPPVRPGWTYASAGDIGPSALAATESAVYAGTWDGMLYALDPTADEVRWTCQVGKGHESVQNDTVHGLAASDDTVYATTSHTVSAVDTVTKAVRWTYPTEGAIDADPLVANGAVFVGTWLGEVIALEADTGKRRWLVKTDNLIDVTPALGDGTVYVVGAWGSVFALDAWSGEQLWREEPGSYVFSASPALANGVLYVGTHDKSLYALDAQNGKPRWRFPTGGQVDSTPVVANGTVYVGSDDGKIYAIDAVTGAERWQYATNDEVNTAPVVVSGVVYTGSTDGYVYALDAATGRVRWTFPAGGPVFDAPVVATGKVYVASGGRVRAVDVATGHA